MSDESAPIHCLHGQGNRPECILCGRCLSVCPLFTATGREELSPRAKFFMDHLRDGIGLRGYGQQDPKQEYKREGFLLFQQLIDTIRDAAIRALSRVQLRSEVREQEFQHKDDTANLQYSGSGEAAEAKQTPKRRTTPKVGRNDPCPCGSGKKYKKCCGNK